MKWRVIQVQEATGPDTTGRFVAGKNVTYQLDSGHTGIVFVPTSTFNADTVKAAVTQDAANLDAVANLTSD